MVTDLILLVFVGVVSYANGSNDISKGIATLIGSGASDYNRALLWGTLCTTAGVLVAARYSTALVDTFLAGLTLTAAPVAVTAFAILVQHRSGSCLRQGRGFRFPPRMRLPAP